MLLHYLGVDFENKLYEFGPAPDFSNASWLADKFNLGLDFPNVSPAHFRCNILCNFMKYSAYRIQLSNLINKCFRSHTGLKVT